MGKMVASFGMYHGCDVSARLGRWPSDTDDALSLAKDGLHTILCSDLFWSEKRRGGGARWALTATKTPAGDTGEGGGRDDLGGFRKSLMRPTMVERRERVGFMLETTAKENKDERKLDVRPQHNARV
jgi:hypothetical protein